MNELILFGDIEEALIDYLTDGLVDNGRAVPVSGSVPKTRPAEFVVIKRLGGPRHNLVTDKPLVTFESWSSLASSALSLAQLVRGLVNQLPGEKIGGIAIYRVNESAGPGYLPDPDTNQARYVFTSEILARAT